MLRLRLGATSSAPSSKSLAESPNATLLDDCFRRSARLRRGGVICLACASGSVNFRMSLSDDAFATCCTDTVPRHRRFSSRAAHTCEVVVVRSSSAGMGGGHGGAPAMASMRARARWPQPCRPRLPPPPPLPASASTFSLSRRRHSSSSRASRSRVRSRRRQPPACSSGGGWRRRWRRCYVHDMWGLLVRREAFQKPPV